MASFNDLAWTESDESSRGVIAGGLENGSLDLWNADKLLGGARLVDCCCDSSAVADRASESLISRTTNHTGAIKSLQFNPKHSNLLATGGAKGEVFSTVEY